VFVEGGNSGYVLGEATNDALFDGVESKILLRRAA
jgi:hypothetical protein